MAEDVRVAALRRSPLFGELGRRDLGRLASAMKERSFSAGSEVTTEGEIGVGFFVIGQGSASVEVGGTKVREIGPGDHFGEISLVVETPRTATVRAVTDLRCYAMTSWDFRRLIESNAAVAWQVLVAMSRRLLKLEELRLDGPERRGL